MYVAESGFQAVYESFHDRILRYLSRLAGEAEAEDLTQEVFLKVSRSLGDFRGESQLSTWIYRIATHAAIDRLRAPAFQQAEGAEPFDEEDFGTAALAQEPPQPDQELMRKEMYDCFGEFVKHLPAQYRAVIILSELEEMPNREIADILGLTLETVKMRLHRGRALLFAQLQKHCKAEDWL
jgi:RNA polymerase sigma-70 factor (ECF subfamily)